MVTGFLRRSGKTLIDSSNNKVILSGMINTFWLNNGALTPSGAMNNQTFYNIANATNKGNFLRCTLMSWAALEPSNGVYNQSTTNGFGYLDQLALWAQQNHVYILFSMAEFCNTNFPLPSWIAVSDQSTDEEGFFNINGNPTYNAMRNAYGAFLAYFANRYASNPFVLLEPFNEPYNGNSLFNSNNTNSSWLTAESKNYAATCAWLITQMVNAGYINPAIIPIPWVNNGYATISSLGNNINMAWDNHSYMAQTYISYSEWQSNLSGTVNTYQTTMGYPLILGEWGYVETNWITPVDDTTTYANQLTYIQTQSVAGYAWYFYADLNTSYFSSADVTWIWANIMAGGTGPPNTGGSGNATIPFSDNFTNLNNWIIVDGTFTLISGGVQGTNTTEALMYAGNLAWINYTVAAPITIPAAGEGSIVFRYQDSNDFYWAGLGPWGHQYSIGKKVNGTYSEIVGSGLQSANAAGTYNLQVVVVGSNIEFYVNGILVLTATDTSLASGAIGLRTFDSTMQAANVNVTTPTTPTYFVNWAITPISGNLPFTISFGGYLSRFSSIADPGPIVNGETIQIQAQAPGSSTWVNTGISETTGTGTSGNGYFSGTWKLTEPGIYPGAWQFRAYYAGNATKYLFGCDSKTRKRDLSRVNALIL
jgi:hypothetical protein